MSEHEVTFENGRHGRQPGWFRQEVHVDGAHVGYLDRKIKPPAGRYPGWTEWFVCDKNWRDVGNHHGAYLDRDAAVDALVAHASYGRETSRGGRGAG